MLAAQFIAPVRNGDLSAADSGEADVDQVSIAGYAGTPQEWQDMTAEAGVALKRKIAINTSGYDFRKGQVQFSFSASYWPMRVKRFFT